MAQLMEAKPSGGMRVVAAPLLDRWHVLHTRPRQEKAVAEVLDAAGMRFYLPCVRRTATLGGRRRVSELPLFSSYVFLHGPLESVYFAVSTKRVVRALEVADQGRLTRELDQVRRAIDSGAPLDGRAELRPGRRVRVVRGPLQGIEGTIEEFARQGRLVLHVKTLAQGAALEIDPSLLEAVDDDA